MREILFKAKRIDNGEWVEGNIILSNDAEEGWETIIISTADSNMFVQGNEELGFEAWHRVDKDTICQYTGLSDKNGNKIWENDIVNIVYSNFAGEVCYSDGYIIKDLRDACVIGWLDKANELEVAGNIFDNPELVERN